MNIKEIAVICELLDYKNFADAAYSLSYSPSMITKYVSNIEKELNVRLFIRSKKAGELQLTSEGKVLINVLRRILADYQYLMELTKHLSDSYENSIKIGSRPTVGDVREQEIMASFLYENTDSEISNVKANSKDLLELLKAGKIDAAFVTLKKDVDAKEYFREYFEDSNLIIKYLYTDTRMYLGISEKYMPGKKTAHFKEFADFTFAFPFLKSQDELDVELENDFHVHAKENGFNLKTLRLQGHDNSVFRLATMKPVAITATNTMIRYKGIKYVRIDDWHGGISGYFLCLKSNRKEALKSLRNQVNLYIEKHTNAGSEAWD